MKAGQKIGILWVLGFASIALNVWQLRESRRLESEILGRFTHERERNDELHAQHLQSESLAKREQSELKTEVESLKGSSASGPLINALADDFRDKSQGYIVEIAKKYSGTPEESFGRESALWHAARLEKCGLLPNGFTPQIYVDSMFKAAKK
jgi:hypothetical protein